ncbi:hypothetical protein T12_10863 [Trichinella patagoniensis]|uniref:Uncharacterized protein n=1 Tax=Trichinella patagoniensis TaxID=990121 RepID=A0A0V0XJ54_9BILA|nr:hypothetical protein T12_10863 [Trichinella patagoniensis]
MFLIIAKLSSCFAFIASLSVLLFNLNNWHKVLERKSV